MRRLSAVITIAAVFFLSCGGKNKVPKGILPQDKMEEVLWDMMRADQYVNTFVLPKDSSLNKKTEGQKLYTKIFDIHKITEESFRESFAYYKKHPVLLSSVMDSISKKSKDTIKTVAPVPVIDTAKKKLADTLKPLPPPVKTQQMIDSIRKRKKIPVTKIQ
jgi:Domain of unknown function (DUF4296)